MLPWGKISRSSRRRRRKWRLGVKYDDPGVRDSRGLMIRRQDCLRPGGEKPEATEEKPNSGWGKVRRRWSGNWSAPPHVGSGRKKRCCGGMSCGCLPKTWSGRESSVLPGYLMQLTLHILTLRTTEVPIASSPITTRWWQSQTRDLAALSFGEEHSTTDLPESSATVLKLTPEKETLIPGSYKEPRKTLVKESFETNNSAFHFCKTPHSLDRGWEEHTALKGQKCLNQLFLIQKDTHLAHGKMQLHEQSQCIWKGYRDGIRDESFHLKRFSGVNYSIYHPEVKIHLSGLRNDYYLNILDWNSENLIAIALGSSVYFWNGEKHNWIGNIDLSLTCNYISSVSWIKEGHFLAVGTSEGEVQLWDVATKKQLRNTLGHLSVVGALSWNNYILSSGLRLGRVYHHDVRVAQHCIGTLHQQQAVCALKWSPEGQLLSSGCSDGLLTIWPHDPGANAQGQPVKVIPQPIAAKAMDWCPWQSGVLAVGGGMEDGHLHILDINTGESIQTPCTNSQICSLIWLPKTKEIVTGQGTPKNDVTVWMYPTLVSSGGFFGHRGRLLHLALSPDQTRDFSAAADGTAFVWKCC